MRWSLSTKVFLSLTTVIFAFGGVGAYGIVQMHKLRGNMTLIRDGILPLTSNLEAYLGEFKEYDQELSSTSQGELLRLRSYFASFKPFEEVASVERHLERILSRFKLDQSGIDLLTDLNGKMIKARSATEFRDNLLAAGPGLVKTTLLSEPKSLTNAEVYRVLAGEFIGLLHQEKLDDARKLQDALLGIVRHVRGDLIHVRRGTRRYMKRLEYSARAAGTRAQLVISIASGVALLIAIVVMILVGLTLRPIKRLREGVRRVAEGDFASVEVNTSDEIGQLAEEFNRMAESLKERDILLAAQREELVRSERLATIGKMSSQITHEIRNPLSSIGLNSELLEEELSNNTEARQLLSAIRGEIDRLTDVTEQYLRFAKFPKPELKSEDLNLIIGDLIEFMGGEFSKSRIEIDLMLEDGLPAVELDEDQIRQVLINLLRNGIEAMPDGGRFTIQTRSERRSILVQISDNGVGIEESTKENIFDPFFTTRSDGTGLGLTLVQQIIHEHGGQIYCESNKGKGSTFLITLTI